MRKRCDVHIVVPTSGERPELLEVCLRSLLEQKFPARVTVITRNDPTELQRRWAAHDGLSITMQRGVGLSAAINQAWQVDGWRSDLTSWLGDDDALPPTSVEAAVARLERNQGASMVHGRCLLIDAAGIPKSVTRNGKLGSLLVGYGMHLIAQPGSLLRTKHVRQVGGLDESMRYAMDVDLFVRLKSVGDIVSTDEQLGVFRVHDGGLSTTYSREAYREARAAMRRARPGRLAQMLDVLAWPTTRIVSRVTSQLPPRPSTCWRPG